MAAVPRLIASMDAFTVASDQAIILEGVLLKRADRGYHWNDRYFTFSGPQLVYYHNKEDKEDKHPKGSFVISQKGPAECDVGCLYIDQRQKGTKKQVLYCFKITWNSDSCINDDESLLDDYGSGEITTQIPASLAVTTPGPIRNTSKTTTPIFDEVSEEGRLMRPKPKRLRWRGRSTGSAREASDDDDATSPRQTVSAPVALTSGSLKVSTFRGEKDKEQRDLTHKQPAELETTRTPARKNYLEGRRLEEKQLMLSRYIADKKESKKKTRKLVLGGSKLMVATGAAVTVGVLTAGVGLLAGLVFIGASAAAGGTGVAAGAGYQRTKRRRGEVTLASACYETARKWKAALDACLVSESVKESTWGQLFVMEGRNASTALVPTEITPVRSQGGAISPRQDRQFLHNTPKVAENKNFNPSAQWLPIEGGWTAFLGISAQGLRICRAERDPTRYAKLAFEGHMCAPLKTQLVLNATPLLAFMCLMSLSRVDLRSNEPFVPGSGQRTSFRVLKTIDNNMDIIHVVYRPLFLFPSWTTPRDFVVCRYWRYESDGTYTVCYESVSHRDCPPLSAYTRGELHGVYTIAPRKQIRGSCGQQPNNLHPECLVTSVVQVDPKGWVPLQFTSAYGEAFSIAALLQLLDIRDALDEDRFVSVSLDSQPYRQPTFSRDLTELPPGTPIYALERSGSIGDATSDDDMYNYDFSFAHRESRTKLDLNANGFSCNPPPMSPDKYAEPDSNSFRVRGRTYKKDKLKINAGSSIGKLTAVDVVLVDAPIFSGFSTHPTERIQIALEREKHLKAKGLKSDLPPFVFILNIVLPGPPFYHGVFYYAIDDMSCIDGTDGTASSKLCNDFFFGASDEFRHKTFKLIPQIVEGNFLVRKAVGSTPAIMGTKLRQLYVRNERFMEVILDCGSSSVATGVIRLSLGYAKTLVIDMGFLFEGNDETTLPERVFGAVRIKNLVFGPHLRKVEQPFPTTEES